MRILIAGTSFAPSYGGPAISVSRLALALAQLGTDVGVWAPDGSVMDTPILGSADGIDRLSGSLSQALGSFGQISVIHDNGIWLPHNHLAAVHAERLGIPRIVSTRGMLEPWAIKHRGWKKRVAWYAYQKKDLQLSSHLHATANEEAESIRRLGLAIPISVIPNGVDLPDLSRIIPKKHTTERKVALFLARVHPKKGLPMLIEAWARIRPRAWILRIAGPDEGGHRRVVERAIKNNGLEDQITFLGQIDPSDRTTIYAEADLFVLPTYSENFGMSIAEALAHNLPVLTTTRAPWPAIPAKGCGWWVAPTVDGIAEALREATSVDTAKLRDMGSRGRDYVAAEFGWPAVANAMIDLYRAATGSSQALS